MQATLPELDGGICERIAVGVDHSPCGRDVPGRAVVQDAGDAHGERVARFADGGGYGLGRCSCFRVCGFVVGGSQSFQNL